MESYNFSVPNLGECKYPSPIKLSTTLGDYVANYVEDSERILYNLKVDLEKPYQFSSQDLLELAGPRKKIFWNPETTKAAIVTCGGLCPGLNDVIRGLVMTLWYNYGVKNILGIPFGYRGFIKEFNITPKNLTPEQVEKIHREGGTLLGSSRGYGDRVEDIADFIEENNINLLFTIGGDGTQKGARDVWQTVTQRGLPLSLIGIPKTIDNDLNFIDRSFGFETAVSYGVEAVSGAHTEAHDAINGIGLVKVMGRESGFIAAHLALAINDVNFVLIPEVPFELQGEMGLLRHLEERLQRRNHAVILVAEGAGQDLMEQEKGADLSGNKKLGDIGLFLKEKISQYFKSQNKEINIKYIDPSYIIRSSPANPNDSLYCARLASNAVHAAMAGKTGIQLSLINNHYVHLPIEHAVSHRRKIDPESPLWRDVVEATGQPPLMTQKQF